MKEKSKDRTEEVGEKEVVLRRVVSYVRYRRRKSGGVMDGED
jgi:hypothetical protein